MIQGEESAKANFALQTTSQARTIINQFLQDSNDIEDILKLIGDEKITGFQLLDVFDETKNYNEIKKKLQQKIISNEAILRGLKKEEDDEEKEKTEPKEKKKNDFPPDDIEKMLKSLNLGETFAKLKENEVAEPEIFWTLDEGELIGYLDIQTEGKKFRFKEALKQAKERYEKEKLKKEEEEANEFVGQAFEKLQKKMTIIF